MSLFQRLWRFGLKDVECGTGDRLVIAIAQTAIKGAQTIVGAKIEFNLNAYRLAEAKRRLLALIVTSAEQKTDLRRVATRDRLDACPGGYGLREPLKPDPAGYAISGGKQIVAAGRHAGMQVFIANRE